MSDEKIYTPDEVSEYLKVPVKAIESEIAAGRLLAMNVGGFLRIRESDLAVYKNEVTTNVHRAQQGPNLGIRLKLQAADDFVHTWPDGVTELFTHVREGVASHGNRDYHIKLGFTIRNTAGRPRRRCLVLVDRYPTVEFVAASDKDKQGTVASIIKNRTGKQIPVGGMLPPEYEELSVGPYRSVVDGPGAANGTAVICNSEDLETMIRHALIRFNYREERAGQ